MKVWTIIFCAFVLVVVNSFVSCDIPGYNAGYNIGLLPSVSPNTDDDDDDRDEFCYDRDSCQDSCDYMFHRSSARSQCYALDFDDVNDVEEVFDILSSSSITKRKLEDLDAGDLERFLELDVEAWLVLINGSSNRSRRRAQRAGYTQQETQVVLEWIGEDDEIADAILEYDEDSDILYTLFDRLGSLFDIVGPNGGLAVVSNEDRKEVIQWTDDMLVFCKKTSVFADSAVLTACNPRSSGESGSSLRLYSDPSNFLSGFIGIHDAARKQDLAFGRDSFVIFADNEDNNTGVELAHQSARRFCTDILNKDEDDEEVGQCLQALYCTIRSIEAGATIDDPVPSSISFDDDVFDVIDNFDGLRENNCDHDRLMDEDNFD